MHSKGKSVTGPMIIEKAKSYNENKWLTCKTLGECGYCPVI